MDAATLWHVLMMDWSAIENTPPDRRRPLEMQRWHLRVERLATMLDRPPSEVASELKDEAQLVADRRRREMEAALAQDFAVIMAQGQRPKPPWRRKLAALAEISGQPREAVQQRVIEAAASIRVIDAR